EHGSQQQHAADGPFPRRGTRHSSNGFHETFVLGHSTFHGHPSHDRPSQASMRFSSATTSAETTLKISSPFSAVANRGSPMCPGTVRSFVIHARHAGSKASPKGTGSTCLRSPTKWGAM